MSTSKSEMHEFSIADVGLDRSSRSVKVHVRLERSFDGKEKGFTDEEINEIKSAEKTFINAIEKVICK